MKKCDCPEPCGCLPHGNENWLVVWNMTFIFPYIGNVIIPIDELIFFRGAQTTNQICLSCLDRFHELSEKGKHGMSFAFKKMLGFLSLWRDFIKILMMLPSGYLTQPWKMAHLQMIFPFSPGFSLAFPQPTLASPAGPRRRQQDLEARPALPAAPGSSLGPAPRAAGGAARAVEGGARRSDKILGEIV